MYPSNRVRTAPPVSVRVRNRVSVSFSFIFKLISGKECIADCAPCFKLVHRHSSRKIAKNGRLIVLHYFCVVFRLHIRSTLANPDFWLLFSRQIRISGFYPHFYVQDPYTVYAPV